MLHKPCNVYSLHEKCIHANELLPGVLRLTRVTQLNLYVHQKIARITQSCSIESPVSDILFQDCSRIDFIKIDSTNTIIHSKIHAFCMRVFIEDLYSPSMFDGDLQGNSVSKIHKFCSTESVRPKKILIDRTKIRTVARVWPLPGGN